jgi:hypothetical protein
MARTPDAEIQAVCRFLVRAAFFPAMCRARGPLVRAAFCAARRRSAADRRRAALRAWLASALCEATDRGSRFKACRIARDRRGDTLRRCRPARDAEAALCFVRAVEPAGGFPSLTPARRAFDNPIAIACFVDRAPCFPSRM